MNLAELERQGLADIYPPLRTRSQVKITTHETLVERTPDGLVVTIKTLFPPSARARRQVVVTDVEGGLHVRPLDAEATTDAQRFAELLRERWRAQEPETLLAPLRMARDGEGRYVFHVALAKRLSEPPHPPPPGPFSDDVPAQDQAPDAPEAELKTEPATPASRRSHAAKRSEKGDS
jgi:hypothetical protein